MPDEAATGNGPTPKTAREGTVMTTRTQGAIDFDQLVQEDRVHGDVYLRPDIFELELDAIYTRGWVYLGHTSEIPEPGDYKLSWMGRASIILTRDESGVVHAFYNRCRHRAATVCQAEQGSANFFRCAYHGWTYDNAGALIGIPYQNGYDESFERSEMGLTPVARLEQYRGFLFANGDNTGPSLDDHLGPHVKAQIDLFCDLSPQGALRLRSGSHRYGYHANWKFQLENTLDGYHPNFVHQSFFDVVSSHSGRRTAVFDGDSESLTRELGEGHAMLDYRRPHRVRRLPQIERQKERTPWYRDYVESLEAAHGKERTQEILVADGTHMNIFPNAFLLGVHVRVLRPITVDRSEVFLTPVLLEGVPDELNEARLRQHEAFYGPAGGGATDDLEMFERNQLGLQAGADPWLVLRRGLGRERQDTDGTRVAQITDELPQRSIWRRWKREMTLAQSRQAQSEIDS